MGCFAGGRFRQRSEWRRGLSCAPGVYGRATHAPPRACLARHVTNPPSQNFASSLSDGSASATMASARVGQPADQAGQASSPVSAKLVGGVVAGIVLAVILVVFATAALRQLYRRRQALHSRGGIVTVRVKSDPSQDVAQYTLFAGGMLANPMHKVGAGSAAAAT